MVLYAESIAVLAWLLGQARGEAVADVLRTSTGVIACDLTLVECERLLIRMEHRADLRGRTGGSERGTIPRAEERRSGPGHVWVRWTSGGSLVIEEAIASRAGEVQRRTSRSSARSRAR
jgi:hypothetical protein